MKRIKLTEAFPERISGGTVVGMAGVASLSSRSLGQDPILPPCDGNSYWTCQTPGNRPRRWSGKLMEIASKLNCGPGFGEGMNAGLVQLVQSAKKPQQNHCELRENRLPPQYKAASCADSLLV